MPESRPAYTVSCLLTAALLVPAISAFGVDLTVQSIEVNQAVQFGSTKLIANNVTFIRVKVGISGSGTAVPNVDAALRMYVDNIPLPGPPVFSINGPITAPLTPNSANIDDTINFIVLPPISNDVDFVVEVNPNRSVEETDYSNNSLAVNNKMFECRGVAEVAYVPINYTANGAGLPPEALMNPGIGDGFVRAIYRSQEWDYHRSPLPPLTWTQNINNSNNQLLNTLRDIRINQLPASSYPQPDFVYGWLPGNPYSGNGQAIGIPGDVAFGNTDTTRHQRTFAHELGHLFGLSHNTSLINTHGVDVEHHLKDTQNIPQIHPPSKKDIMYAGQLTNAAFVNSNSYNVVLNDNRMACDTDDNVAPWQPVLRVSGVIEHDTRNIVAFNPVMRIALGQPATHNPDGDLTIAAYNVAGDLIYWISVRTDTARQICGEHRLGQPALLPDGPFHVLIPDGVDGQPIHRIELIDTATGQVLSSRQRSPNQPQLAVVALQALDAGPAEDAPAQLTGRLRAQWTGDDLDGDALSFTLLYSPDGGESWLPLAVNLDEPMFEFDTKDIPASREEDGIIRLIATDGFNTVETDFPMARIGTDNAPETFLISPNHNATFPQHAPIAFRAVSWDKEDRMLEGESIVWTSTLDGEIGTGRLFIKSDLSLGMHSITVTGTDSAGLSTMKIINITITPRVVIDPDCNGNGVLDTVDIDNGSSSDANANSIPDECEEFCAADITADGAVDVADLLAVINAWGPCGSPCPPACNADVNGNCAVDVADLLAIVNAWGPCE